ncbi:F0F1 ATP synthase subunit B [Gehongia tenuis]|uniref:ATP synthase subunit b n=1 Tax=Gehongia tenuis TaxID=2763655 RepID=A0A926D3D2_9FIRM|nr:F0F1 ATP synthase subunit B [Gehongia tenuis]MBC8530607.1 F0F1 ATP synthase subunit B [Gehongia tenuis]
MELSLTKMLIYALNIGIIYLIYRWLLYKPVHKFLAAREERFIARDEALTSGQSEVSSMKKEYKRLIGDVDEKRAEIIEDARRKGLRQEREIVERAEQEADLIRQKARREMEEERRIAQQNMEAEAVSLAVDIASKVLEREVSLEDNRRVIDDYLERLNRHD